ncbi:unnamed protein product [Caenorhabditis nigoni]
MPRSYEIMSSLSSRPVSIQMIDAGERVLQSSMSNQKMNLGEWIKHIGSFSESIDAVFSVEDLKFDIPSLRNTLPRLHHIGINCMKDEPDDRDIFNVQYLLRTFLSYVRNVSLVSVPLGENLSLQHIGTTNLKHLSIVIESGLNLADVSSWNFETCDIWIMAYQKLLFDLNRFFKLWIKGTNPKLKKLSIHWDTGIIPDWNVLLKELKAIKTEAEEEGTESFIIRNIFGINAEINVDHDGHLSIVTFTPSN